MNLPKYADYADYADNAEYAEYAEYKDSQVQHITLFLYSEFHEENLNHQETNGE